MISRQSKKTLLSVIFFLIVIAGLGAALILVKKNQLLKKGATGGNPSITLSSANSNININKTFNVNIAINTGNTDIGAVDAVINFPQDKLILTSVTPNNELSSTNLKTFVPLLANDNGHFNSATVVQQANNSGKIEFGAITFDWAKQEITSSFNTEETDIPLATLAFRTIKTGQADIAVDYAPDSTADSNLVKYDDATDILAEANSITINISESSPTLSPPATLNFKIKFQGINGDKGSKTVRVRLRNSDNQDIDQDIIVVPIPDPQDNSKFVYSGSVSDIVAGTYDILIKEPTHLQKKFASITLSSGDNSEDWTNQPLMAGDFGKNNKITFEGITGMISAYTDFSVPVNDGNRIYDVDENGVIDMYDIIWVIGNYTDYETKGDQ